MSTQPIIIQAEPPPDASPTASRATPTGHTRLHLAGALALLVCLSIAAWFLLHHRHKPDALTAPIDQVLDYTLLTEDFNRLPLDQRLALIQDLVSRFKTMSGDDSVLMAAFAAGIRDSARKQIERNASLIALDVWDKYARQYHSVPADKRSEFLDQTFLELDKLADTIGGNPSDKTDAQRLADARRQAKHDGEMFTSGKGPTGGQLARMASKMRSAALANGSPQQLQRCQQLMLDMTIHMRSPDNN